MAFDLTTAAVVDTDPIERDNGPGRALNPETVAAVAWLTSSYEQGDGTYGKPKGVVVPAGESERVLKVLTRAAQHLQIGLDKQAINLKGGKVEIRFATRPKRVINRKPKADD